MFFCKGGKILAYHGVHFFFITSAFVPYAQLVVTIKKKETLELFYFSDICKYKSTLTAMQDSIAMKVMKEVSMDELNNSTTNMAYYDGDIAIMDNIKDLPGISPFYAKMNFIIICMKGRMNFNANDQPMSIHEGDLLVSASYVILDNYMFSSDFECKVLCLSDDIIQELLRQNIIHWNLGALEDRTRVMPLSKMERDQIVYYYELLRYKLDHPDRPYSTQVIRSIMQAVLYDICATMDEQQNTQHPDRRTRGKVIFDSFLRMLSAAEVKRQPVSAYASKLNITPKYLTMICTRYSGKSAMDWITQYCKEDIRYYLCHTDLTVKEVCGKLGFTSLSFFGSYVRKRFGVSPTVFKQQRLAPVMETYRRA